MASSPTPVGSPKFYDSPGLTRHDLERMPAGDIQGATATARYRTVGGHRELAAGGNSIPNAGEHAVCYPVRAGWLAVRHPPGVRWWSPSAEILARTLTQVATAGLQKTSSAVPSWPDTHVNVTSSGTVAEYW